MQALCLWKTCSGSTGTFGEKIQHVIHCGLADAASNNQLGLNAGSSKPVQVVKRQEVRARSGPEMVRDFQYPIFCS